MKDVILPGEMRDILNQVVALQKEAEANVIRRREETNATRSLLNTATIWSGCGLIKGKGGQRWPPFSIELIGECPSVPD